MGGKCDGITVYVCICKYGGEKKRVQERECKRVQERERERGREREIPLLWLQLELCN